MKKILIIILIIVALIGIVYFANNKYNFISPGDWYCTKFSINNCPPGCKISPVCGGNGMICEAIGCYSKKHFEQIYQK
jgi:hypothetical protein